MVGVSVDLKKIKQLFLLSLFFSALLLSGCGQTKKAKKEVDQLLARAQELAKQQNNVSVKKKYVLHAYAYQANASRDPFNRVQELKVVKHYDNAVLTDEPLDQLVLVGTMVDGENSWAVLRSKNGALHHVMLGMHIGLRQLLVSDIKQNEVVLKIEPDLQVGQKVGVIVMKVGGLGRDGN